MNAERFRRFLQSRRRLPVERRRRIFAYGFLLGAAFLVYGNSLGNKFTYDDWYTIGQNHFIRSWRNFPAVFSRAYFRLSAEDTFRPVVTATYFLDYSIHRLNPAGYHLTNLLLHAGVVLLAFRLFSGLLGAKKAFVMSLLFLVFPVNTEAVNAISFREDLLVALFCLAAFLFYTAFRQRRERKKVFLVLSVSCYFLAMLSKESGVVFPLLLLVYEHSFGRRPGESGSRRAGYAGFGLALAVYLTLRFLVFVNPQGSPVAFFGGSPLRAAMTVPTFFLYYLHIFLVPYPLLAEYPAVQAVGFPGPLFWLFLLTLAALVVSLALAYRRSRTVFFGLAWWVTCLLPTCNIVPLHNPIAERYLYLAGIGFFLVVVHVAWRIRPGWLKAVFFLALAGAYSFVTVSRNPVWKDEIHLWSDTIARLPRPTGRAHTALGIALEWKGRTEEALAQYAAALRAHPTTRFAHYHIGAIALEKGEYERAAQEFSAELGVNPGYGRAYCGLACALLRLGRDAEALRYLEEFRNENPGSAEVLEMIALSLVEEARYREAEEVYRAALAVSPGSARIRNGLGILRFREGRFAEAEAEFREAIRLDPSYSEAHCNLGTLQVSRGDIAAAVRAFTAALRSDPCSAAAHYKLANVLMDGGKETEAIQHYMAALRERPVFPVAFNRVGLWTLRQGKTDEAIGYFLSALKLDPNLAEAHDNLGCALASKSNLEEALKHFSTAVRLDPGNAQFRNNLGTALARQGKTRDAVVHFRAAVSVRPDFAQARSNLERALKDLEGKK